MDMEFYTISLDNRTKSSLELFERVTETIFLGESDISNWDSFYDLFFYRLSFSDIRVVVEIDSNFILSEEDAKHWKWVMESLTTDCPDKISFIRI